MSALALANAPLAFALELAALWGFGRWAYAAAGTGALAWGAALGFALVAAMLWGLLASPRAPLALSAAARWGFKVAFFALAAAALAAVHGPRMGLAFGLLALLSLALEAAA